MKATLIESFIQDYLKVSDSDLIKGIERHIKIQGEYVPFLFSTKKLDESSIIFSYDILDIENPRISNINVSKISELIELLNIYLNDTYYVIIESTLKFLCIINPNLLVCKEECEMTFEELESKLKYTYPALRFNFESNKELAMFCCMSKDIPIDNCTKLSFIQYPSEELYEKDEYLIKELASHHNFFVKFCLENVRFDEAAMKITFQEPIEAYSIFEDEPYSFSLDSSLISEATNPNVDEKEIFFSELSKHYPNFDRDHIITIMRATSRGFFISAKMCNQYNITLNNVLRGNLPQEIKRSIDSDRSKYGIFELDQFKHISVNYIGAPIHLVEKYIRFYRRFKPIRHPVMRKLLGLMKAEGSIYLEIEGTEFKELSTLDHEKFLLKWVKQLNHFIKFCKLKGIYCLYLNINQMWGDENGNIVVLPSATRPERLCYLSPEELLDNPSENSEMYRLGCFLYEIIGENLNEMTPGKPLYGNEIDRIQYEITHRRAIPIFNTRLQRNKPKLCEIIRRLMNYNWKSRITCEELSEMLV